MANLIHNLHFLTNGLDRWLPAFPYLGIMLALVVSFLLFVSVKTEVRQTAKRTRKSADRESKRVNHALAKLAQMAVPPPRPQIPTPEPIYIPVAAPAGFPVTGFNINRRVQALRMLRRGEDTAHIAAALAVSRREVELLIRMQQIVSQAARPHTEVSAALEIASPQNANVPPADMGEAPVMIANPARIETSQATPHHNELPTIESPAVATTQPLLSLNLPAIRRPSAPATVSQTRGLLRRRTVAALA
jgi:hypothetical protein